MGKRKRQPGVKIKRWAGFVREDGSDLDAAVWGELPPDIHLKLLQHLPWPALLRFQVVCKAWYNAIRTMDEVGGVDGDCFVARLHGRVRVYSGRHKGVLQLPQPDWAYLRPYFGTTGDGRLFFDDQSGQDTRVYSLFTGKIVPVPPPPAMKGVLLRARVLGGDDLPGEFTMIRVVGDGCMLVYESGRGTWEVKPLKLPAGEVFAMSRGVLSHATIHGSTLYFLTFNLRAQEMSSIRCIDLRRNVDGTTTKVSSWPSLPSCYVLYQDARWYYPGVHPDGRPFTGNIAVAGGKLFMACLRSVTPDVCTVALLAFDKQGKRWEFVSEMPLTEGFVAWEPKSNHHVQLRSRGAALVVSNNLKRFTCLFDTSTKVWSLHFGGGDTGLFRVCPFTLSMRFA